MPQALVVYAHPDGETAAVGARLRRFRPAYFVHVTDGAPRDERDSSAYGFSNWMEYRDARARELDAVFTEAGIPTSNRENLGMPDQEACRHLANLTRKIERLLHAKRPEAVFTHPYEYGHPDHDACAFAVHHAVALAKANANLAPVVKAGFESLVVACSGSEVAGNLFSFELPEGQLDEGSRDACVPRVQAGDRPGARSRAGECHSHARARFLPVSLARADSGFGHAASSAVLLSGMDLGAK